MHISKTPIHGHMLWRVVKCFILNVVNVAVIR